MTTNETGSELPGIRRLTTPRQATDVFLSLTSMARHVEALVLDHAGANGFCVGCRRWQRFVQPPAAAGDWANLLEGLVCECGLNARMRLILNALDALNCAHGVPSDVAVLERLTPLFPFLQLRLPGLEGSEYLGPDFVSGEEERIGGQLVRHESLLSLSYPTGSLDMLMHFDVLEHVPDIDAALRECRRVLKSGGRLLFSCPFYEGIELSIVRAEVVDGELLHRLEPCYHGNPVDGKGALVFTQPGWDLMGRVREAGFAEVELLLCYDPVQGITSNACPYEDGHMWPVVFSAVAPQDAAGFGKEPIRSLR